MKGIEKHWWEQDYVVPSECRELYEYDEYDEVHERLVQRIKESLKQGKRVLW